MGHLNIIGETAGLKGTLDQVRQVAPTDAPVLLLGETGTGKELLARAIHNLSPRSKEPFVTVNCAAIPPSLIDSELFGHVKGAFTGATTHRKGRFERADGGTIFLDEIGELPLDVQSRLLRVIQEQEIERVGGSEVIPVNNRIIAATHRDLYRLSEEGSFRRDLFFRLRVFPIEIPPLRERVHDIPALLHHFIVEKSSKMGRLAPHVSLGELETIMSWSWKGNVRELENAVEEALIRNPEGPLYFTRRDIQAPPLAPNQPVRHPSLDELVSEYLTAVLKTTDGRIKGAGNAADVVGLKPSTLRAKLIKYGIPYGRKADK
jgi:transcriptional regulator with GAF, ATPase, and Fis domain